MSDLINILKAAGVINELVFRVTADGMKELVSPDGFAFGWTVEPAEFTFDETVALGTVTLPSLLITITDEEGTRYGFRLPLPYALMFIQDSKKLLNEAFHEGINTLISDYKNASKIAETRQKLNIRKNVSPKNLPYEDAKEVM